MSRQLLIEFQPKQWYGEQYYPSPNYDYVRVRELQNQIAEDIDKSITDKILKMSLDSASSSPEVYMISQMLGFPI